jgi:hypothetical protein
MSIVWVIAPSLPVAAARICNQSDSRFPQDLADSFAVRFGDATPAWTPPHRMAAQSPRALHSSWLYLFAGSPLRVLSEGCSAAFPE